jgi:hypothetical protein
LKEGVEDVIKHRKPTAGLDESDAAVIELGRTTRCDRKPSLE